MGAIDEISGNGKGALLAAVAPNTAAERHQARISCATHALGTQDPPAELRELLAQLGLDQPDH